MATTVAHNTHRSADTIAWIAFWLMVVGGVNWGLVGLFDIDLVATLFGVRSPASRIVYSLVGVCTLYCAFAIPAMHRRTGTTTM